MKQIPSNNVLESMLRRSCVDAGRELQAVSLYALGGGGRTRANLLLLAAEREDTTALQAACALEMMHAATLLQDDIFDRSDERRGSRAAYLEFGEAQAVLASDWLLLRSLELAAEVHPSFFRQLACAARTMAVTVARELHPTTLPGHAAARSYIEEICQGKTASLFAVSLLGAALLHPKSDLARVSGWAAVGNRIGCTYQLLDDCLDAYAPEGSLNKNAGVDLQQGRLTLPLLTALQTLQSVGRGISIDRFREVCLNRTEVAALEHAIADEAVRTCLQEQVRGQIRSVEESARMVAVPCAAMTAVLNDMEAKVVLCFGENGRCVTRAPQQYSPVLMS